MKRIPLLVLLPLTLLLVLALFLANWTTDVSAQESLPGGATDVVEVDAKANALDNFDERRAGLEAPVLLSPLNGAITTGVTDPPVGLPTFQWKKVPNATRYLIQISASAGFADPVVDQATYALSYTPVKSLADGVYYWRVKAEIDREWGPDSEIRSFEKRWTEAGILQPVLLSPPDGAVRSSFEVSDFSWSAINGAAHYYLEISTDPAFSSVVYDVRSIKNQHTPTQRFANNIYYWRVTPVDNQEHFGLASEVHSFTFNWASVPTLLSPSADAETSFVPKFSWTAVEFAWEYRLEISTQSDFGSANVYVTRNTGLTPVDNLSNDQDYYWRVQVKDYEGHNSPWSQVRRFRIKWEFQPQLLTPRNNSLHISFPFFSWTPIPGAEKYQLQIDDTTSFSSLLADIRLFNSTTYAQQVWNTVLINGDYYWRVRGLDAQGNLSPWSAVNSFRISYTNKPTPIYPLYYYAPDTANTPIFSDRSMAWPLFLWDSSHVYIPAEGGAPWTTLAPDYYELTLDDSPVFASPNFQIRTQGNAAAPTLTDPFTATVQSSKLYYWRLRAYLDDLQIGSDVIWRTRIDPAASSVPTAAVATPIYPAHGFEAVSIPPVLGWLPVDGAANYRLQLARDEAFTQIVEEVQPQFANYVPWQTQLSAMPFGTYWWRVKTENPDGAWSTPRRFNLSVDAVAGNPIDLVPPVRPSSILSTTQAYDPDRTAITSGANITAPYGIGAVHAMLDRTYTGNYAWVFGFATNATAGDSVTYGLYLDADHVPGSGATADPFGRSITVDNLYLPEYLIYLERGAGNGLSPSAATYLGWNGTEWEPAQALAAIGGDVWFDEEFNAVQLLIPYTALGSANADNVGSLAFTLFSTSPGTHQGMLDSAPIQSGAIDHPAFISDMIMPLYPFDTAESNPIVQYDMPALRWRMPAFDSVDGYQVELARDQQFTDIVDTWETSESGTWNYFALMPTAFQSTSAVEDNESYFWRVRIRHERYAGTSFDYGPWSPAMRFKLDSRQVSNLSPANGAIAQISPTFSWDRTEGAAGYTIQIDDDANFSSLLIEEKVDGTSYTPYETSSSRAFKNGTNYYWRVAMRRSDKVLGHWTQPSTFVKQFPWPDPIEPISDVVINEQPTFVWSQVLTPTVDPRMSTPRYRLQIDNDPNFSSPSDYSTSNTTYTLEKSRSLDDGTWYWRVAMIDGNGIVGPYSPIQRFYKEYLPPILIAPAQGTQVTDVPTFVWSPVNGAAYYRIEVANNELYNSSTKSETDDVRFTPTYRIDPNDYYWRVQIFDDDRHPGPYIEGRVNISDYHTYLPMLVMR